MDEQKWKLERADETTRAILCALLQSSHEVLTVPEKPAPPLDEQWRAKGQCIGSMYAALFDKVLSKLGMPVDTP